jgi:hypothetical protein
MPPGSRQRDDPCAVHTDLAEEVRELALASEERLELCRQVRVVEAPKRGEGLVADLEQPQLADVLQAVHAEVAGRLSVEQVVRRLRDDDLPAVCCAHHARSPVDVRADVASLAHDRLARVHADPHAHRPVAEPRESLERRRDCVARRGERDEERVPLRVDLDPAVPFEGVAKCPAVLLEHVRVPLGAELVEQLRRALDVGEEERDGAGGELPHGGQAASTRAACAARTSSARRSRSR